MHPGFKLIAVSEQPLTLHVQRQLVTMEKIVVWNPHAVVFVPEVHSRSDLSNIVMPEGGTQAKELSKTQQKKLQKKAEKAQRRRSAKEALTCANATAQGHEVL